MRRLRFGDVKAANRPEVPPAMLELVHCIQWLNEYRDSLRELALKYNVTYDYDPEFDKMIRRLEQILIEIRAHTDDESTPLS